MMKVDLWPWILVTRLVITLQMTVLDVGKNILKSIGTINASSLILSININDKYVLRVKLEIMS